MEKREKNLIVLNKIPKKHAPYEEEYLKFWKNIISLKSPWAFRLYSHYTGPNKYILSQPAATFINNALNPLIYIPLYKEKNLFDRFLPGVSPKTILRIIDAKYYSSKYQKLELKEEDFEKLIHQFNYDALVAKPTVNAGSGIGVLIFKRDDKGKMKDQLGNELTLKYLNSQGSNILLQEGIRQHPVLNNLCSTSLNTIRISTYKSVIDDDVKILSGFIRIGNQGSVVDNAHQGGAIVKINENGQLGNYCTNQYGSIFYVHNGIDFSKESIIIPKYETIKNFAKTVASSLPHLRLLQLDITLDSNLQPWLIEYNCEGFAPWVPQFLGEPALGKYSEEIIEYAKSNKKAINLQEKII